MYGSELLHWVMQTLVMPLNIFCCGSCSFNWFMNVGAGWNKKPIASVFIYAKCSTNHFTACTDL